jgi:transposase
LINWHRKRYCPKGFRPPYVVRRAYEWTYLYAAVDPTSGESFSLYLPGMDSLCFERFLERLGEAYADHDLVVVLDGAPSHTSKEIELPENVSLLALPSYSPELNPVERWFQELSEESSPTSSLRPSSYCKRRLAKRLSLTGRSRDVCNDLPVSPGGWKPSSHWDINTLDWYNTTTTITRTCSKKRLRWR